MNFYYSKKEATLVVRIENPALYITISPRCSNVTAKKFAINKQPTLGDELVSFYSILVIVVVYESFVKIMKKKHVSFRIQSTNKYLSWFNCAILKYTYVGMNVSQDLSHLVITWTYPNELNQFWLSLITRIINFLIKCIPSTSVFCGIYVFDYVYRKNSCYTRYEFRWTEICPKTVGIYEYGFYFIFFLVNLQLWIRAKRS